MPRINVLKSFVFVLPVGSRGSKELRFRVGEHEVSDEVASHPWIRDDLADGAIESPAQARERIAQLRQAYEAAAARLAAAQGTVT